MQDLIVIGQNDLQSILGDSNMRRIDFHVDMRFVLL